MVYIMCVKLVLVKYVFALVCAELRHIAITTLRIPGDLDIAGYMHIYIYMAVGINRSTPGLCIVRSILMLLISNIQQCLCRVYSWIWFNSVWWRCFSAVFFGCSHTFND